MADDKLSGVTCGIADSRDRILILMNYQNPPLGVSMTPHMARVLALQILMLVKEIEQHECKTKEND